MRPLRPLILGLLLFALTASTASATTDKFNSSLRFLRHFKQAPTPKECLDRRMLSAVRSDQVVATIKFDHVLSPEEIIGYEQLGLSFYRIDDQVARTEAIYPVQVPWAMLDELAGRLEVVRLESAFRPAVYPTLDVSGPEIEADSAWTRHDPLGLPLTGQGMRIADFDTGIDVFHPSFFYADGDTFDWLDVTGNGSFNPGSDRVDLNRNGLPDSDERLRFFEGWTYDVAGVWGSPNWSNDNNQYQTYWDWLYADQNGNAQRDYGPARGFTESDPTFGEPVFIVLDDNDNGALDPGEKLVALGTSKVYATMNTAMVERIRGTDLIHTDGDASGHGTAVCGILSGGTRGRHIFPGIAPDAEILAGDYFADVPISYLIPWARSRGADVMLYEFGGFIYHFLDGSSLDEELVTIEHRNIIQVTPSGNLGRGNKHALTAVAGNDSVILPFEVPSYNPTTQYLYSTTLWRLSTDPPVLKLKSPRGSEVVLDETITELDGYNVWFDLDTSSRGTHKADLYVDFGAHANVVGQWHIKYINNTHYEIEVICNVADDLSSWAGGVEFSAYMSDNKNVTFPATADTSLVNGSYSTRGFSGYAGVGDGSIPAGEISKFSGRGRRINGQHLLDLASPGNYDVYTTRTHTDFDGSPLGGYRQFSGTSAAGPHVAAAAALVLQAYPGYSTYQIEYLLTSSTATDAFTGDVYNNTWGYGKLRILSALGIAIGIDDLAFGLAAPRLELGQNYPNPFNPVTWIPFYLPSDGLASLKIYNVKGELVTVLRDRQYSSGPHSVLWDGRDSGGRPVATGMYFCVLRHGGQRQSRKLVLVR